MRFAIKWGIILAALFCIIPVLPALAEDNASNSQIVSGPTISPYSLFAMNEQQSGWPSSDSYKGYTAQFRIGSYDYYINDSVYTMDVKPYASRGRGFVPVRFLAYACGISDGELEYWPASRTVTINGSSGVLRMRLGSNIMYCNDQLQVMDVCPEMRTDRIFLPARYVAEFFGYTVEWDENTRIITISS